MKRITSKKEMVAKIAWKLTGSRKSSIEDCNKILTRMYKNDEFHLKWKVFEQDELYNAEYFAICGGIALHKMNIKADVFFNDKTSAQTKRNFNGKEFAHLFGPSEAHLIKQAALVGCKAVWVQRTRPPHFDLVGTPLARALVKCAKDS